VQNWTPETKLHQHQNQWQEVARQEDHNKCNKLQDKSRNQFSLLQKTESQPLYHMHKKRAHFSNGMWQHIQNSFNWRLDDILDTLYQKLDKKLDTLIRRTYVTYNTENNTRHTFHSRPVNLTNIRFTKEQINTLTLGFIYAVERTRNTTSMT